MPGRIDLADALTLSRLPLAGLIWLAVPDLRALLAIGAVAALTDVLDGWAARRRPGGPRAGGWGAWLDPLCDKVFLVSLLGAVWLAFRPPAVLVFLIGLREVVQVPLVVAYRMIPGMAARIRYDFRALAPGKATTTLQFLAVAAIVLDSPWQVPLAFLAAAMGLIAVTTYLGRAVHAARVATAA